MTKKKAEPVAEYLQSIEGDLKAGNATEHTYRPALKQLIERLGEGVSATNEPKRIECGAPDFIVTRRTVPLGYVEAKDVGLKLDRIENDEQIVRYRSSLSNLILTDYLEFRLYRNGEPVQSVRLAKWPAKGVRAEPDAEAKLVALFQAFFDAEMPVVIRPRDLAERMARTTRMLHDLTRQAFVSEGGTGDLHAQFDAFKRVLISELTVDQFADMYAQTIAYGLFAARCNHPGPGFTRERAGHDLPRTNPFLRRLFNTIAGPDLDERIAWAVDDLALLLARADMTEILANFGRSVVGDDPVVHFYETFLAAYDPKVRELRGVYYTPEPVVRFIVESVHRILIKDFSMADGLADRSTHPAIEGQGTGRHRLVILDPATGTGTFLRAVIDKIYASFKGGAGAWPGYVSDHVLPRLIGFELLMAPYAVAHLKLALTLAATGYDLRKDERLRVYLTNTLDEPHVGAGLPLFAQWLAEEANVASDVKKTAPVMVVLGNPPYSGESQHSGDWINRLMRGRDLLSNKSTQNYFTCDGKLLRERQSRWINDDYIKFIRFAQWRIESTGHGILAYVTNRNYLDNITFRGVRQALLSTFNKVYVVDLHGDAMSGDKPASGIQDENVFDITKGAAISIFVRTRGANRSKAATVSYVSLRGSRTGDHGSIEVNGDEADQTGKYEWLRANNIKTVKWHKFTPDEPYYSFVPENEEIRHQYRKEFVGVDEIFKFGSSGFVAGYSEFAVGFSGKEVLGKFERFVATESEIPTDEIKAEYKLKDSDTWKVANARAVTRADSKWKRHVISYLARPFDIRTVFYSEAVLVRPVRRAQRHMLSGDNLALLVSRQTLAPFRHVLASRNVVTFNVLDNAGRHGSGPCFPLYTFPNDNGGSSRLPKVGTEKEHNLQSAHVAALAAAIGMTFVEAGHGNLKKTFGPEDVFAYIYAVLHSRTFRARFDRQLRTGFPRVPMQPTSTAFQRLSKLGRDLVDLHTFSKKPKEQPQFPIPGDNAIRSITFEPGEGSGDKGRVWINKHQYFDNVPTAAWEYQVGRYVVCNRWLGERVGRKLSFNEIDTFGTIAGSITDSLPVLDAIEDALTENPLWASD